MSQAHLANIAVLGNDTTARNSAVGKIAKPTVLLTTTAPVRKEIYSVVLDKNSAGKIVYPESEYTSTFEDEKALLKHLIKASKDTKHCVLYLPDPDIKTLKDSAINAHVKIHIKNGKREECPECGTLTIDLPGHPMVKHGSDAEQQFKCQEEDCNKRSIDQKKLDKHVKNSHTDEEVECQLCQSKTKPVSM